MIPNAEIDTAVEHITPGLVRLRRKLHEQPELAFEEYETASSIAHYLTEIGIETRTGVGKTGVVGLLNGASEGRRVGLRADIDALPILEQSGVVFASQIDGRMHACGHDVHTVIALGAAHILTKLRARLDGSVTFIFQPAEETLAGATAMIDDGVLGEPTMDCMLGFHNWPLLKTGLIGYHANAVMASSDAFDIILKGKAGHAAHPHTGIDAIVSATHLVSTLQTIVSREIAPAIPTVITIGQIEGGTARNVIADQVVLKGTVRTLDSGAAKQIEASVRRIVEGVAMSLRMQCEIVWKRQAPVLKNDPRLLGQVLASARNILSKERIVDLGVASMGSEDFAWFGEHLPIAHIKIGSKIDGLDTAIHRSNYDYNELAIPIGVRVLVRAILDLLARR